MVALPMNRGLADVEPIERPDWTRNLISCGAGQTKELAQKLWTNAEAAAKFNEAPIALKVVDSDTKGFVEFDLTLAIIPLGFTGSPEETETLNLIVASEHHGEMAGLVGRKTGIDLLCIKRPQVISRVVLPEFPGRTHFEMGSVIRLAPPYLFGTSANIQCGHSDIHLEARSEVFSRWIHWYADWEPMIFPDLGSTIGSMTTILKSSLDEFRSLHSVEIARLVRVRRATRHNSYSEFDVKVDAYWL